MFGTLLKLGFFLVVGILVYNLVFGDSEEKAQSKAVFQQAGKTVGAAWNMLKSERQKFDAGKYDGLLGQLGGAYREIRDRAEYVDQNVIKRLDELERRKAALEQELDGIQKADSAPAPAPAPTKKGVAKPSTPAPDAAQDNRKKKVMDELDALMRDSEQLLKDAQQ
jgi:hypothetical protein